MRWKAMVCGLVLTFATASGCKQQCFLAECDYDHYRNIMPAVTECTGLSPCVAPAVTSLPAPATLLDPERKIRYLSLEECIAIALEQGFQIQTNLQAFEQIGQVGTVNPSMRVLALDPAIAATNIDSALSRFDARWQTSMNWSTTDRPVGTSLDVFQAQGKPVIDLNDATFSTGLIKPLPTGGVAAVTFSNAYELSNLAPAVNPSYRPTLQFSFEQPLLQGFGVEINQIRSAHPGSLLNSFNDTTHAGEGILLTRLTFDTSRVNFETQVSKILLTVEKAYWDLYGAYWTLYSREQGLRQAYETWRVNKAKFDAGRSNIQDLGQARGQYELFRAQRIQALSGTTGVLEAERNLRGLLGLPAEDGSRLVPIDSPIVARFQPDWYSALNESMTLFPDLIAFRNNLKRSQLDLINQKNLLLPDVRFTSTYDFNSIGSRLDGPGTDNALRALAQGNFSNWSLGIRAEVPLGFRDAHAGVRASRLRLAQDYIRLRDRERELSSFLVAAYRGLIDNYQLIEARRAQRIAFAEVLQARFRELSVGKVTVEFLLESQRDWADALAAEYQSIVDYNKSLVDFQFVKGTLLQYNNVVVAEGALPDVAQVRAVDNAEARRRAIVLHEHADPMHHNDASGAMDGTTCADGSPIVPALPTDKAVALPTVMEMQSPIPEIREPIQPEAKSWLQRALYRDKSPRMASPTSLQMPADIVMPASATVPVSSTMPVSPTVPVSNQQETRIPLEDLVGQPTANR